MANYAPKKIPIEDIIHYKAKGLSHQEIANIIGCNKSNVTNRLKEANVESLNNYNKYKDVVFEHLQRRTINKVTDDEIKRMNPLQRVTAAAILEDKIRHIRGQATDIQDHKVLQINAIAAVKELRRQVEEAEES